MGAFAGAAIGAFPAGDEVGAFTGAAIGAFAGEEGSLFFAAGAALGRLLSASLTVSCRTAAFRVLATTGDGMADAFLAPVRAEGLEAVCVAPGQAAVMVFFSPGKRRPVKEEKTRAVIVREESARPDPLFCKSFFTCKAVSAGKVASESWDLSESAGAGSSWEGDVFSFFSSGSSGMGKIDGGGLSPVLTRRVGSHAERTR